MKYLVSNYHAHTTRCGHAFGTEREYIEAAIECGIREFGFSDHAPIPYEKNFVSGIRMGMEQAEEYVNTLRKLGEEYKNDIHIYVGFEAEYLEEYFEEQMKCYDALGIDYLILGQHFNKSEKTGPYNAHETTDYKQMSEYVDVVIKAAQTGRYLYIAHPDIINFVGDKKVYEKEMTRLCTAMKELNIPLEINVLGAFYKKNYPCEAFFDIASKVQNDVILGLDAHTVDQIYNLKTYEECMDMVKRKGLHLLDRMEIIK